MLIHCLLSENAIMPRYAHDGDAGLDLYASEPTVIPAATGDLSITGGVRLGRATVHTGVSIQLTPGTEAQVRPRSGLSCNRGVFPAFGTIDSGYRGEIMVCLYNTTEDPHFVKAGDRIAQLVIAPVIRAELIRVAELGSSERGVDGFGSTGK